MANLRPHFNALLKRINPSDHRLGLAERLPGEVRKWLKDHDFETVSPHTRLSGSYKRQTAICDIPDVDVLPSCPTTGRRMIPKHPSVR